MYPTYPEPRTNNIKPIGWTDKRPTEEVIATAQSFHNLGLFVVPKRADDKIAHWKFWMIKGGHVPLEPTPENLRTWLPHDDINGLILAVGRSMGGRLVVLDIDPHGDHATGKATYDAIQSNSPTGYVITTPSNGLHLYYTLPEGVEALKPTAHTVWENLDIRCKNSLLGVPGSMQQYTDKAEKKGVEFGHVGYYRRLVGVPGADYSQIPAMNMELYTLLWEAQNPNRKTGDTPETAESYGRTVEGLERLKRHMAQPLAEREKIVMECLDAVLTGHTDPWKRDTWLQVAMAAHQGSDGSAVVRDYIITHPNAPAFNSDFRHDWDNHTPREDGYTIASLMWLARQHGWLSTTGLEIPEQLTDVIDVHYIQEWAETLPEIPARVLLMSQTGSGKTYNLSYLYERLGKPKTVIFVPTVKLAMELAGTLKNDHHMPVTLYIDPKSGRTLDADTLESAHVLVTTLQTFSAKVHHKGIPMSRYGLVYVEECDQLIQQFSKGGGGVYGSHVSEDEARRGYACLRDAFENSGSVWCVDATMTQITYHFADAVRGKNDLTIVKNAWVEQKAPVRMLAERGEAYQMVLGALLKNQRVVVVADTATIAEEVVQTMVNLEVLNGKRYLLITGHTERNRAVHDFMGNVNQQAQTYDLVAYNSVMASGVSITSVNPDVIVQICTYLTPRVNLQLLNRYRQQTEVYCYYGAGESLYTETEKSVLIEAYRRAGMEAHLVNIPLAERTLDATLRSRIAAMSIGDEAAQRRSPRDFYTALLKADGREVTTTNVKAVSGAIKHSLEAVRAIKKEQKEFLRQSWQAVRVIDRDNPADPDMTDLEVAQGEVHAFIHHKLHGNVPADVPAEEIYDLVHDFSASAFALEAFVKQGKALQTAQSYLADEAKAITTLANNITLIRVLTLVHLMYTDLHEELTTDVVKQRAKPFLLALYTNREEYDAVTLRQGQKFNEVLEKNETDEERALAFAKILLARVGLRQRVIRGRRTNTGTEWKVSIANSAEALRFLDWRYNGEVKEIAFSSAAIDKEIDANAPYMTMFEGMTAAQRKEVLAILNEKYNPDLKTAVESVIMGVDSF